MNKLKELIKDKYPHIYSILIAKQSNIIFEEYFTGNGDTLYEIASIDKVIVSTLIGTAFRNGLIDDINL